MEFNDLTEEQKAKITGKSPQEIFELVKEEGHELTDEELESIAGGENWGCLVYCPTCGTSVPVARKGERVTCSKCNIWIQT